jgi:hypothetical protein
MAPEDIGLVSGLVAVPGIRSLTIRDTGAPVRPARRGTRTLAPGSPCARRNTSGTRRDQLRSARLVRQSGPALLSRRDGEAFGVAFEGSHDRVLEQE